MPDEETGDVDVTWNNIKETFNSTSTELLGRVKPTKTKEWLTEATRRLAAERRMLKPYKTDSATNRTHHNYLCREVQRSGRADKEAYLNELCKNVEEASVQSKSRMVYQSIKQITGKKAPRVSAIKDRAGKILTDPEGHKGQMEGAFRPASTSRQMPRFC